MTGRVSTLWRRPLAQSPCVKCGSDDVVTSYHPRRSYCDPHSRLTFNTSGDEHLHRKCRNCGYDWTGPVLTQTAVPSPRSGRDGGTPPNEGGTG